MTEYILAVDIGGTKTAAALVDPDGRVGGILSAPTPARQGPDAVVGMIAELARALQAETPGGRLIAVGVGTAGVVDVSTGTIVSATDTFTDWVGTVLGARIAAALGVDVPVHVQNDVDAHAAGEFWFGAAAGASSALVVAVGTGIGAGVIVDGELTRGAHHVAGELGHLPIAGADHLRCPCGRSGHLEALGSGVGLYRHYLSLGGDTAVPDTRGVVARAAAGDQHAIRAIADSAGAVGRALAAAATLLDPETIVLTGGVAQIGERWWQPMIEGYRAEAIDVLQELPILPGALGAEAPLRGAAASARRMLTRR